jgi:hypothetical protein
MLECMHGERNAKNVHGSVIGEGMRIIALLLRGRIQDNFLHTLVRI